MIKVRIASDMTVDRVAGLVPGQSLLINLWDKWTIRVRRIGKEYSYSVDPTEKGV